MRNVFLMILISLALVGSLTAADFFSTAYVETFRIDTYESFMVSPNLFIQYGRFELYGFIDRYTDNIAFYHGELLLSFQPLTIRPFDRVSIIAERRWDKFAVDENSYGLRIKIW